jgi:hypothetical protein
LLGWVRGRPIGACRVACPRCGPHPLFPVLACPPSRGWPYGGELPMPWR